MNCNIQEERRFRVKESDEQSSEETILSLCSTVLQAYT